MAIRDTHPVRPAERASTPPRPRLPAWLSTVLFATMSVPFIRWCQRRYGDAFALRLGAIGEVFYLSNPGAIRRLFRADGTVSRAGEANSLLEPIGGPHSLLLLDDDEHLHERRMLTPCFHGEALRRLEPVARAATVREMASWPADAPIAVRPAMQRITFDVIAQAVLGTEDPVEQRRLTALFEPVFAVSMLVLSSDLRRRFGSVGPWARFRRARQRLDEEIYRIIAARRDAEPRPDILGLLLQATDTGGRPLSDQHIRDELVTLLLAGHETTATALAWAFELLAWHPEVAARLRSDQSGDQPAYLEAVIRETLRVRPVIMDIGRLLGAPLSLGDYQMPAGTVVVPGIYLVQRDERNHERAEEFRPERFLNVDPDPATWLPFGGGRRRCIGANLALMEMRAVLLTVLATRIPAPAARRPERPRMRGVTLVPHRDARLYMRQVSG